MLLAQSSSMNRQSVNGLHGQHPKKETMKRSLMNIGSTFCSDKIEINLFCLDRVQHVWHEPEDGEADRGGSVIIMGCKSAKDAEEIIFIDGGVKARGYTKVLNDKFPQASQYRNIPIPRTLPKSLRCYQKIIIKSQ